MITKFRIGTPIDTESVVNPDLSVAGTDSAAMQTALRKILPDAQVSEEGKSLIWSMEADDIVYGLGETIRGMNKRGWIYKSNNSDDPFHLEEKHSLYGAHNFLLISSADKKRSYALYLDNPGLITYDIGYTKPEELKITLEDFDFDLYLIEGESMRSIVREFRQLIGRSYLPPKWAFGYAQSRWGYRNEDDVRKIAKDYREAGIPIDAINMDIDYMERYKDFTVDEKAFPEFPSFVQEMKKQGIHLVPIIDAGVKIEDGYNVYEDGRAKGYFCTKEDGSEFVAAVWPGRVLFPDFLNEEARNWFGEQYKVLLDQGIDGFWNDMNEPAIFYSEDHLKEVFEEIEDYKGKNLDIISFFQLKDLVGSIDNNPKDYRSFYHNYKGQRIRHDKVHNLFGYNMTRAAGDAFARLRPGKRTLMYSRSSFTGMHRYGGIWTGDNRSWWSHILMNLQQMPGLNMNGFLYCGADMGGFSADTTEDLVLRWFGVSLFTPLMRNHSAAGTRQQEVTAFEHTDTFRKLVELRYALLPYLYSEFMKAALKGDMYMMPLSFEYPEDERARNVEDQLLVGESIMIAPVYQQNAKGRYVYLPEEMKLLRFRAWDDYDEEVLDAGDHYVPLEVNEVAVFLRKDHVLPFAKPARCSAELDYSTIRYFSHEGNAADYELYDDDGESMPE